MRPPHEVLGVSRTATAAEARRAYRRLAKACHPDTGGTVEAMAELNAAYEGFTPGTGAQARQDEPTPRPTSPGRGDIPRHQRRWRIPFEELARMPFGQYKGRVLEAIPPDYLCWVLAKADAAQDWLKDDIRKELDKRWNSPGPMRRVAYRGVVHMVANGVPGCRTPLGKDWQWRPTTGKRFCKRCYG